MKDLIKLLDSTSDLSEITKEQLFAIKAEKYYLPDIPSVSCQQLADASEETTEPGAYLLWEFTAHIFEKDEEAHIFEKDEEAHVIGRRLRRFADLLKRLEISTRYDCFDSYGSQSEDPHESVIEQPCFESDDEFMLNTMMPISIAGGFYNTEKEFKDRFICED